ncbi:N-acetyltransferase [Mesobaculum littorinae]|uniref:N-acetyltransferase n=1 Tax=Mesobaculum littorinae TaxID=2486419 RepID=A0A438AJ80_9RHOB|nr:GNAT family N-acetyltransferase [Mesobaculum littorinae]RVV98742.1 N-acetyltransferase [Mesobaculum littorinae]
MPLSPTAPPTLATDRLRLRPMRADDWPAYAALMASARARYMGGPFASAAAWGMFCADHAQWDFLGCGALMIEERDSGRTVGQIAVNAGPLFPEHELGWCLYDGAEGRGIAAEAAQRMLDWARDTADLPTLVSYIDAENAASRRLAERLGAQQDPAAARPGPDDLVYRHFGAPRGT